MKKGVLFLYILSSFILFAGGVYAVGAYNNLHLNIQTTFSNGSIQTGTFDFVFNISDTLGDCASGNIVYTNSTTLTTDSRGIISYYLPDVNLDYRSQYWLCYYKDGVLTDTTELSRVPYAFQAGNVTLTGVQVDSNLNMGSYNVTASHFFGDGSGLTGIASGSGDLLDGYDSLFFMPLNKSAVGNFTFYGNLSVFNTLATTSNGIIYLGRTTEETEYIKFDTSLGTNGKFIFSAPLQVAASSPGITFYDPSQPTNTSRQKSIDYSADTSQLQIGDSVVTNFGSSTGGPPSSKAFFQIGQNALGGIAPGGVFIAANTPSVFGGDLIHLQVGNTTRFRVTNYGDVIIRSGVMSDNAPILNTAQTWSSSADFTAWLLNITDVSSGADSKLINLIVGGASKFVVEKDGSVGIGIANPTAALDVLGTINASQILINGTAVSGGGITWANAVNGTLALNSSLSNYLLSAYATNNTFYSYNNPFGFYNSTTLPASAGVTGAGTSGYIPLWNGTTSLNNSVIYQSGSNVGIGTSSPAYLLDLNKSGIGTFSSSSPIAGLNIENPTQATASVTRQDSPALRLSGNYWDGAQSQPMQFYLALVDNGVGTNAHLVGYVKRASGASTNILNIDASGQWNVAGMWSGYNKGEVYDYKIRLNNDALANASSDQFAPFIRWYSQGWDTGTSSSKYTTWEIGSVPQQGNPVQAAFVVRAGVNTNTPNTEIMRMTYDGTNKRVGIGTATPQNTLNVLGDANVTGNLYANGQLIGSTDNWNSNYSAFLAHINWSQATNGTLMAQATFDSNYSANDATYRSITNTSYYLATNPFGFYNSTTLPTTNNGTITGTGTQGYVPLWNGTTSLNNSVIYQNGSSIGIGTTSPNEPLEIGSSGRAFFGNGAGAERMGLLIDGNEDGSYTRIESYKYGTGVGGKNLVFNAVGGGNVGIGTTSPSYKLDIQAANTNWDGIWVQGYKSGSANAGFTINTSRNTWHISSPETDSSLAGGFFIYEGASTNRFTIQNSTGNVGIGTTSPGTRLEVVASYGSGIEQFRTRETSTGGYFYAGYEDTGNYAFLGGYSGGSVPLVLQSAGGNVGIGTTTPQNLLNVLGDANITGTLYANGQLVGAGSGTITGTGTQWYIPLWNGTTSLNNSAIYQLGSSIGIGTANPFPSVLSINGTSAWTGNIATVNIQDTSTVGAGITLDAIGGGGKRYDLISTGSASGAGANKFGIFDVPNGLYRLIIDTNGNVGVGAATPQEKFHVNGTGGTIRAEIETTNPSSAAVLKLTSPEGSFGLYTASGKLLIHDYSTLTDKFTIDSSGEVGINTTTPQQTLNVVGDANITGLIYGNGSQLTNLPSAVETDPYWNANYSAYNSTWSSITNTSYYLATNPFGFYNSTTLPSSGVSGAGTQWYVPLWNGTTSLNNSVIYQKGSSIGIGTANPASKLDVNGSTYLRGNLSFTGMNDFVISSGAWNPLIFEADTDGTAATAFTFRGATPLTDFITIRTTGKVGINTTNPQQTLNVVGDANVTQSLTIGRITINTNNGGDMVLKLLS